MDVQVFTPQEYIAGCYRWALDLVCTGGDISGDHYVFNGSGQDGNAAIGEVTHPGHFEERIFCVTDTSEQPSWTSPEVVAALETVGEFPGLMGNDQNTHGNPNGARTWMQNKLGEYIQGVAWTGQDGELHFHEGSMEWILVGGSSGTGPNAS